MADTELLQVLLLINLIESKYVHFRQCRLPLKIQFADSKLHSIACSLSDGDTYTPDVNSLFVLRCYLFDPTKIGDDVE